jgi:Cof subfamily protein (haloacid dehalogenase superfamily)
VTDDAGAPALPGFDPRPDIRLIAADMDGTLLDDEHELHEHFWPLVEELHARGIMFCPASGRQYFNLLARFEDIADDVVFIAENGTFVVYQGHELSSSCLEPTAVRALVDAVRGLAAKGVDLGAVVCGKRSAYIERGDAAFHAEADRYYAELTVVDDLGGVDDDVLKVAVFDFGSAEHTTAPGLERFAGTHRVVVSGKHWVDVMNPDANKGSAIRTIQRAFGITSAQTMVFGDFLNDLEMMDAADYSFAMHNAHPQLRDRARYVAPPNSENGVVRVISAVLGLRWTL